MKPLHLSRKKCIKIQCLFRVTGNDVYIILRTPMTLFTGKLVEETIHPFELKRFGLIESSFVIFFTMCDLELMTILHLRKVDELICSILFDLMLLLH